MTKALTTTAKVSLIEAPPGIGKTGIALAISRLLDLPRTHILTGTKQLQEQYASLGLPTAKGRGNFDCVIERGVKADAALCTVGGNCDHAGSIGIPGCPYFDQKRVAWGARESVWNYSYWFYQQMYAGFPKPDLLICDEAHQAREHVRSFVTIRIVWSTVNFLKIPKPPATTYPFEAHQQWAREQAHRLAPEVKDLNDNPPSDRAAIMAARRVHALSQACIGILRAKDEWVITSDEFGLTYRPVWPDSLVNQHLTSRAASKVVFMSATILSKEAFCKLNGLPEEDVDFIRVPSTFDKKRRPIFYWPQGKVKRGDYQPVLQAVERILEKYPTQSGLIHTVSYDLAKFLEAELQDPRTITHTGATREQALDDFRTRPGMVLISPSMTTGVDLPYDQCRFQIICKLPFPDLGDQQIKAAMKEVECAACDGSGNGLCALGAVQSCGVCHGRGFVTDRRGQLAYNYQTACAFVQTYGRIMRAEDDAGDTWLLDGNYGWFKHANREMLPVWFTEAVQTHKEPEKSIEDVIRELALSPRRTA